MEHQSKPLTRAEAIDRAALLNVHGYDVAIDLTGSQDSFGSTTVIQFSSTRPGATTFVELKDAVSATATLNGRTLGPMVGNRLELAELDLENVLEVRARLPYIDTGEGMHRFVDPLDGGTYIGAYLGVDNSQRLFACFDQPDLKAPITLHVNAPDHWSVVANSVATAVDHSTGLWDFAATPRISPYLFALVAGPLHTVEVQHRGIPFTLHARKSLAAFLDDQAPEIFRITTQCFDYYHEIFDQPYPFDSYGQAFVPELNWGAMESPGCITLRDEYVFRTAVSETQQISRAMIIAHEMAHMWFGNLVTLEWWDDIWLNESFAEFLGYEVAAHATVYANAWAEFSMLRKIWGYDADQRSTTHAVAPAADDVLDTETALANFDGISYSKGASALRQLVAWLGRDTFLVGVNTFFGEFAFSSATFGDLLRHLANASGRDVHAWADAWLRNSGVDTLEITRVDDGIRLVQSGARPHLINIGQYEATGTTLSIGAETAVRTTLGAPVESYALPAPNASLLLPNSGDLTFAKLRLDTKSHKQLTTSISSLPDAVDRAVAWTYLRDLVRDAELSGAEYLEIIARQLPTESDSGIAQGIATFAQTVAVRFLPPDRRSWGRDILGEATRPLLSAGGDLPLLATRVQIWAAQTADDAVLLREWLDRGSTDGGLKLDADLRWRILARLAALNAASELEIETEQAGDRSGLAQEGAARAKASLPIQAAKEAAWHQMFGAGQSNYVIMANAETFWQPEQEDLVEPFLSRYFEALQTLAATRGAWVSNAVGGIGFPYHRIAPDIAAATAACIADKATVPSLKRRLTDSLDDYGRVLASLERFA